MEINLKHPLAHLPNEQRHEARERGLTQRRTGRPKKNLPRNWRERVYAVCSKPFLVADLAVAMGMSQRTFDERRAAHPEVNEAIAQAKACMHKQLVEPLYKRALRGDSESARWLLAKTFPVEYGDKPQGGISVNVGVALPRPMTEDEYRRLFAKPIEAKVNDATD